MTKNPFLAKLSIFGRNFDFWMIFRFVIKYQFLTEFFWFLTNIYICWPKRRFLGRISIFDPNLDCWPKFRFFTNMSIFEQNFGFWPTFRFLTKTSIFGQNFYFWPKFRFLTKIFIFYRKIPSPDPQRWSISNKYKPWKYISRTCYVTHVPLTFLFPGGYSKNIIIN